MKGSWVIWGNTENIYVVSCRFALNGLFTRNRVMNISLLFRTILIEYKMLRKCYKKQKKHSVDEKDRCDHFYEIYKQTL